MRSFATIAGAVLALSLTYGVAAADTVKYTVAFEPAKQGGPGTGNADLSLDTSSKKLTMTITYTGLTTPPAMAAFLSPPEKQGGNPGTLPVPLPAKPASPVNIIMQVPDKAIDGLKSGEWVLLLGTKQEPEIGGEVKPAQ